MLYILHSVHSKHCEAGTLETTIINSAVGAAGSHSVHSKQCEAATLDTTIINSAVGAAGSPLGPFETLWSCNINRRVAALRARTTAIYRTKEVPHTLPIFSRSRVIVDHHMSICQTGRPVACTQCASRTEAHFSASLRAWRFSARATVVRARFLAAAFSDGSYLAHVNGAYLRHVKFCIVRGPPLFIVSPISQRGPLPRLVPRPRRRTPASPILV